MRPSFSPRLINPPFEDPGVFIPFAFQNRAVIFDLGDIYSLSARDVLKISHVFVSHTHMDHFVGFDRLLRLFLGREKTIYLFGPQGLIKNAEAKLGGYEWNLVQHFKYHLDLQITEVYPQFTRTRNYCCRNKFLADRPAVELPFNGVLYEEPAFRVSAAILDHGIPCLGFSLEERFHVNIVKDGLKTLGLEPGRWLSAFKQALYQPGEPGSFFKAEFAGGKAAKQFRLEDLAAKIARITPGQKISYITDVVYSRDNAERIVDFIKGSDLLFIEAPFLQMHSDIAREKKHLTAWQAGQLAARAGIERFSLFHFSPRYTGQEQLLRQEAAEAFTEFISGKSAGGSVDCLQGRWNIG
jgi:ribonuclease Z